MERTTYFIKSDQDKSLTQEIGIAQSVLVESGKPVTSIRSRSIYMSHVLITMF